MGDKLTRRPFRSFSFVVNPTRNGKDAALAKIIGDSASKPCSVFRRSFTSFRVRNLTNGDVNKMQTEHPLTIILEDFPRSFKSGEVGAKICHHHGGKMMARS